MMSMPSGDVDEPRQQMTDGVSQQGTAELSGLKAFVYQNSQLKLDALRHLQPLHCVRSGVIRSYLEAENTSRAAEFNTDCIRLVRWDGMPASVALP